MNGLLNKKKWHDTTPLGTIICRALHSNILKSKVRISQARQITLAI